MCQATVELVSFTDARHCSHQHRMKQRHVPMPLQTERQANDEFFESDEASRSMMNLYLKRACQFWGQMRWWHWRSAHECKLWWSSLWAVVAVHCQQEKQSRVGTGPEKYCLVSVQLESVCHPLVWMHRLWETLLIIYNNIDYTGVSLTEKATIGMLMLFFSVTVISFLVADRRCLSCVVTKLTWMMKIFHVANDANLIQIQPWKKQKLHRSPTKYFHRYDLIVRCLRYRCMSWYFMLKFCWEPCVVVWLSVNCLERLVSEMTYYILIGTWNLTILKLYHALLVIYITTFWPGQFRLACVPYISSSVVTDSEFASGSANFSTVHPNSNPRIFGGRKWRFWNHIAAPRDHMILCTNACPTPHDDN